MYIDKHALGVVGMLEADDNTDPVMQCLSSAPARSLSI